MEEPLPNGGSCLLGSFNLSEYVKYGNFDYEGLEKDVQVVVRAMNEVLDEGLPLHPLQIQRDAVRDYRQIGIGIMGLADMLIKLEIEYGSPKSIRICDSIGTTLANSSLKASALLAKEFGVYPKYNKEVLKSDFIYSNVMLETYELIKKNGLRNSQILTIPPTGTISTMLGISGGIEPIFSNSYMRKTESLHSEEVYYKIFTPIVDEYMKKNNITEESNLPKFFVTAMDLDPIKRVKMQSVWQRHIDASISSTVNLPNEATVEDVYNIYMTAWKKGLKGITIYRSGCKREGVLTTKDEQGIEVEELLKRGDWESKPSDIFYVHRKLKTGCGKLILFVGVSPSKRRIFDVYFKKSGKGGCGCSIEGNAILMSGMLRLGGNLKNIDCAFRGMEACNSFVNARAKGKELSKGNSCPSALLNILKEVEEDMLNDRLKEFKELEVYEHTDKVTKVNEIKDNIIEEKSNNEEGKCPECGESLSHSGGCRTCPSCGFSFCG